jgi:5-deoxy-glucuronate isomerase
MTLRVRPHAPDAEGCVLEITPQTAGWSHVGFKVIKLEVGQKHEGGTPGREACIVILTGRADYELDLAVMRAGAADFLNKDSLTPALIERSLRYTVQQRRAEEQRLRLVAESEAREHAEEIARTLAASEFALKQLNESLEQRVAERTAVAEQRASQLRVLARIVREEFP